MKKKILARSLLGFPIGIALGYLITIILSIIWGNGKYSPCRPELAVWLGNEIRAVLLQAFLSGILGSGFGGASVIWEMEGWNLLKQTSLYFLIISVAMMPTAYICYWMEHSVKGILSYFGIFVFISVVIWLVQYAAIRHHIKKLNETLRRKRAKTSC